MKFNTTKLNDLMVIQPTIFEDERGYFIESYNQKNINKALSSQVSIGEVNDK